MYLEVPPRRRGSRRSDAGSPSACRSCRSCTSGRAGASASIGTGRDAGAVIVLQDLVDEEVAPLHHRRCGGILAGYRFQTRTLSIFWPSFSAVATAISALALWSIILPLR